MKARLVILACFALGVTPARASTYFDAKIICPVGGEKFTHAELGSISQWGSLPDGMPLGSGYFPIQPAQCPKNGLVIYRDFDAQTVQRLKTIVESDAYQALYAAKETRYFLAYYLARELGDADAPWLLLRATWEAKNQAPDGELARRYGEAFITLVQSLPVDATILDSIALRARASNALRELGRFEEAEAMRAAIQIAPDAGGQDAEAKENRAGWGDFITRLAAVIERRDSNRSPIDMIGVREAAARCLAKEFAEKANQETPPALTLFETEYCKKPDLAEHIVQARQFLGD
ncbi:hypothetical protein Q4610_01155 [Sphingobium sp. HBC34]|uniref:Uncharacterized protein n=1 Tax=Sphingobium cyanobacteriorum TaxID=3063954 RepID=A0ABT8ZGH2_9SPHN|nr:hypothetical protein [Sphingobium sp. HBC34]MDO7833642.1 hypothetical protein [Sphingobium sp. HBC34]